VTSELSEARHLIAITRPSPFLVFTGVEADPAAQQVNVLPSEGANLTSSHASVPVEYAVEWRL